MMPEHQTSRRSYVKRVAAGTGITTGLAGCLGGDDGDERGTTDGLTEISVAVPTVGYWTVIFEHLVEEGIVAEKLEERGYIMDELVYTWDDMPLFVSNQIDIIHNTPSEMGVLALEQQMETITCGRHQTAFTGWWTTQGSRYDPAESGGRLESIERMVEDDAELLISGWGGSTIPAQRALLNNELGYDFSEGGDFNVITTGEPEAIPELLVEGNGDVGSASPMHGGADLILDNDQIVPVFQNPDAFRDVFDYIPSINNINARREFFDEHPGAVKAIADAWAEGHLWFYEAGSDAIQTETDLENLGIGSFEAAEYVVEWGIGNQDVPHAMDEPVVWEDAYIDDEFVENASNFLDILAEEEGIVAEDWRDYHEFVQMRDFEP